MYIVTISLKTVPKIKPISEPIPERKASEVLLSPSNSPINAPRKGPAINPQGMKNMPIMEPITQPHFPHAVPPKSFTPNAGMT